MEKELEIVLANNKYFISFLAGFIDAEGSIFISRNQAVFSLGNYDFELLGVIKKKLLSYGIVIPKLTVYKKLYLSKDGYRRNDYYWQLRIHKKDSLMRLFKLIGPHLKHEKRIEDMGRAINNIKERNLLY